MMVSSERSHVGECTSVHTPFCSEGTDVLSLYSNRKAHFAAILIKCLIMVRELLTSNLICFSQKQSLQQCARKI